MATLTLPDVLSPAEIEQLLSSFGDAVPSCKRAYAMVRCLVDLGLRAGEVARLQLDDLDWRAGTLRIAQGKSRRKRRGGDIWLVGGGV